MTVKASDAVKTIWIAINEVWGYIFGKWGQEWTAALQAAMEQTTADKYATARKYGARWIGHRVADCSGLIRWLMAQYGISIPHSSNLIWSDCCKKKGKLVNGRRADGYILRPGSAVFLCDSSGNRHHVGLYIGDDICIEAKGTKYGVVTSAITHWDEWGELNDVDYSEYPNKKESNMISKPVLKKGDSGTDVQTMQKLLIKNGYILQPAKKAADGADGVFGKNTESVLIDFQADHGIPATGICSAATWMALEENTQPQDKPSDTVITKAEAEELLTKINEIRDFLIQRIS